ncbi:NAD(P)/FAD-dependent oxidoreductase [Crossiella sp. SN42]|uniref:NAD(P)/FAD-dependent oxidoreductase n=1 Tax=Crossiella sp. SN42 TaxID=2944808 RepID=UPI00207C4624|nr:NAD(P)/FAD-dependent oxidoreductase [Crossiella sp. SN42]MCO1574488.1 NAD(P)/FAD-dependent oxidoreductase [Crossiella sp. SN42]
MTDNVDVLVIGGGAAGLSGALTLARARRKVLVLDAGEPRNAPASGVHGFLTRDGLPPAELVRDGVAEVRGYGGEVRAGTVTSARRTGEGFEVETADGQRVRARRLLVTTGLTDELPAVAGVRERWGRDVLHCPYCHGWEVRDQPIGVLGSGPNVMHMTLLLRQWSQDVVLFRHTAPELTAEDRARLAAREIAVVDGEVAGLEITEDRVSGVRLADGRVVPRRAIAVLPRFLARAGFLAELGLKVAPHPMGEHVQTDGRGQTSVPGVWAAGNVTDLSASVVVAAAAGMVAGAGINGELVAEDTRRAVSGQRFSAEVEARLAERVLGERRHGLDSLRAG